MHIAQTHTQRRHIVTIFGSRTSFGRIAAAIEANRCNRVSRVYLIYLEEYGESKIHIETEEESTERDEFINNGIWDIKIVRTVDSIFIFSTCDAS